MSEKLFKFKTQKSIGDKGEALFSNKYPEYQKLGKKDDYDFQHPETLVKIELKTDTYPLSKSANHFIEKYSDNKNYKLGGPYRCTEENSVFVYYHINDDRAFFYNPIEMVEIVDAHFEESQLTQVRNGGYFTLGYKVPRELLEPALIKIEELKKCTK